MTGVREGWRNRLALLTCAAALALTGGCGDETTPGEEVPALADRLDRVDEAIEAGDYADARAQLDRLVAETARADVAGQISDEQADRILNAVADVLAGLPQPEDGTESTDPSPDPTPDPMPSTDVEDLDEDLEEDVEEDDEEKDKGKGHDKDGDKGSDKGRDD